MEKVKCECGHVNPHGTIFCESCGKPVDNESEQLLNMRYEGSARRSQTYNKTIIDKVWNFFSSVKVGIWLIIITLVASSLGTILPQQLWIPPSIPPSQFYEQEYGFFGKMYYELGFYDLYSSWWYMILVGSIAVSLVICSLDRVVPLYKALKKQGAKRHSNFLKRQRFISFTNKSDVEPDFKRIKERLVKKRYKVLEEDGYLLAEKGRFSRWGPYINHIGLIIFLFGVMLRSVPGMYIDEELWLREGETKVIPGTNQQLYLENKEFIRELYTEEDNYQVGMGIPKNYQTDAVLYKAEDPSVVGADPELKEVMKYKIRVNHPLKYDHYALYQMNYKLDEFHKFKFIVENKETDEKFGDIVINLAEPQSVYDTGNGTKVELMEYFPDFYFNQDGDPATKTRVPNNPAFVFKIISPEKPEGEVNFVGIGMNVEPFGENQYRMAFSGIETRDVTALIVRRDFTLGVLIMGGIIFMIGLIQGSYWNHRRIWIQPQRQEIWLAAHTNKNWFGLKKEIEKIIEGTKFEPPLDQAEKKKEASKLVL